MSETNPPSKPNPYTRKKLTPFLAREMIYEYATGALDADRRAAVEAIIESDQESQTLLKNIGLAQTYAKKLSGLEVDSEILVHLLEAESAISLGRRYSSWREWPETLRWSFTAIALSAVVAGAVALVPWSRLMPNKPGGPESIEVAQIAQPRPQEGEAVAANDDQGSGDEPPEDAAGAGASGDDVADSGSGDDMEEGSHGARVAGLVKPTATPHLKPTPKPTVTPKPLAQMNPAAPASVPATAIKPVEPPMKPRGRSWFSLIKSYFSSPESAPTPRPTIVGNVTAPSPAPSRPTSSSHKTAVQISDDGESNEPHDSKAKGFVYRAFMTLDNLEELGPKITDDLVALGAEKAGEVELGWRRGTGRYYHFALPETNEKKVIERLQVYGPVRISKDPHPRVMPPGEVRFILWVESASP